MAVVGWFLCFPAFFFWKDGFFFPIRDLRQKKKVYATYTKKKISVEKKNATYAQKKKLRDLRQKKKATYAYFHNRVTLSSHTVHWCAQKTVNEASSMCVLVCCRMGQVLPPKQVARLCHLLWWEHLTLKDLNMLSVAH